MTTEAPHGLRVVDVPERGRYEAIRDGEVIAFAAYQKTATLVVFTHTEVDPGHEGQGVGGALVNGALEHVRTLGLRVLPLCPFVRTWMVRHPEFGDLEYRQPASKVSD
jgi:predicted GNAT family acetyltransferase